MSDETNREEQETLFDGDLRGLLEGAVQMHEMYLSLVQSGFTQDEALTLIAKMVTNTQGEV